ncbi:MAG: RNA polymerase sigma factor [Kiloniellales bacterium]|nr:RNA polymerase sigma factor [Kiloniellales bacterium]
MNLASSELASEAPDKQPDVVDLEERSWLARHRRGDTSAFPALMAAYRRPVYSYLVRSGVAEADRDDVFQAIFLKIHAAAESYDPARPLAPWLFTIVANSVRNHHRDRPPDSAQGASDEDPLDPPAWPDPGPGPEQIASARQTLDWLEGALADLPPARREVLLLTALVGLRQQDVARALDLPLNTVKTHLRRARLALAARLAARQAEPNAPSGATGESHE